MGGPPGHLAPTALNMCGMLALFLGTGNAGTHVISYYLMGCTYL